MKFLIGLSPRTLKIAIIGVPLLLTAIYLAFFAADRYVSESTLAVRQGGAEGVALPGAAMLMAGLTPPSREDTLYVQRYIHSLALLQKLDAELKIREHFATTHWDLLHRVWRGSSQEDFLRYYRSRVQVTFDDVASLLTVRVEGFDPEFAQLLNRRILEESERFVNEYSQQIAREHLQFAEGELKNAAKRVEQAKSKVLEFQSQNRQLDPIFQAEASGALAAELLATKARLEGRVECLAGVHERRFNAGAGASVTYCGDKQASRSRTRARHQTNSARGAPQPAGDRFSRPEDADRVRGGRLQDRPGRR